MQKRVLSFLLVLAMVFSLLPVGVIAEATDTPAAQTTDTFTFTFERVNEHAAVKAGETVDVNVYLNWSGAEAQSVNGFQLTFGSNVTVSKAELVGAVEGAAAMNNSETKLYWLDQTTENNSKCYTIGSERLQVATVTLTVNTVDSSMTLETLLGAYEGKVCIWSNTTFATDAEFAYQTNSACSHAEGVTVDCGHDDLTTEWTALTADTTTLTAGGHYYLAEDITLTGSDLVASSAGTYVLCLNEHTLTPKSGSGSRVLRISTAGANVIVCDCTAHVNESNEYVAGTIKPGSQQYGTTMRVEYGSLTITGGIIDGSGCTLATNIEGAALYSVRAAATINMYGGEIRNIDGARNVFENRGTANISNVKITGCDVKEAVLSSLYTGTANTAEFYVEDTVIENCSQYAASITQWAKSFEISGDCRFNVPVVIREGKTLTIGQLAETASIGVLTAEAPASTKESKDTYPEKSLASAESTAISSWLTAADDCAVPTGTLTYANDDLDWNILYDETGFAFSMENHYHAADEALGLEGIAFKKWTDTTSLPTSGNWYLANDVTVTTTTTIAEGNTLNLCLNGKTVTLNSSSNRMFYLEGTLNIFDENTDVAVGGFTMAEGTSLSKSGSFAYLSYENENSAPTLNLYNGKITGFTTTSGGTIHISNRTGSSSSNYVYYAYGGIFNMYGGEISGNKANAGGAVNVTTSTKSGTTKTRSEVNIYGGTIADNVVTYTGSAIYGLGSSASKVTDTAYINIYGGTIRDNYSDNTKSVSGVAPGMIATNDSLNVHIQELDTTNPIVINAGDKGDHAIAAMHSSKYLIEGAEIAASGEQCALYGFSHNDIKGKDAVYQISNTTIDGTIQCDVTATATFTDVTFKNNVTFAYASALNGTSDTAVTKYTSVTFSGNIQMAEGKVMNLPLGESLIVKDLDKASAFTFTQAGVTAETVTADPAKIGDVAIITASGDVTEWPCQTVKFHNGTEAIGVAYSSTSNDATEHFHLTNDHVHADGTVYTAWTGVPTEAGNYYLTEDVTLTKHSSQNAGWYISSGAYSLCLNGHKMQSTAKENSESWSVIKVSGQTASLTIDDCTAYYDADDTYYAGQIRGGRFAYGGGVRVDTGAHVEFKNGIITDNVCWIGSSGGTGAGVYLGTAATFLMEGGEICGNTSESAGGAAGVFSGSTFTMTGGKIWGNTTGTANTNAGSGTIYVSCNDDYDLTTVRIEGGEITGNTVANMGGAIHMTHKTTLEISGGTISNNTAVAGGAISVDANKAAGEVTISGGKIYNNRAVTTAEDGTESYAEGNVGGAIYLYDAKEKNVTISGGEIYGNSAYEGGGIYKKGVGCNLTVSGGSIGAKDAANTAANAGGGIYILVNGVDTTTISGGTVAYNTATGNGGGIYIGGESAGTVNINGTTVIKGNSGVQGGGICIGTKGPIVNITDITIGGSGTTDALVDPNVSTETDGSVSCGGGGLFVDNNQTTTLTNVTVQSNQANRCGAGIAADNSANVTIIGGKVQYNKTTNQAAAGIYFESSSVVTLNAVEVTENWCKSTGGVAGVYFGASSASELILIGDVIIDNNYYGSDNTEGNMFVSAGQSNKTIDSVKYQRVTWSSFADNVKIDGLTSGARIGVTLFSAAYSAPWMYFTAPMTTTKDLSDCFFSDKDGYGIVQLTRCADLTSYCRVYSSTDWFPHAGGDASATQADVNMETEASTRLYLCGAVYNNTPYTTQAEADEAYAADVEAGNTIGSMTLTGADKTLEVKTASLTVDLNGATGTTITRGEDVTAETVQVTITDSSTDNFTTQTTDNTSGNKTTAAATVTLADGVELAGVTWREGTNNSTDVGEMTSGNNRYLVIKENEDTETGDTTYSFHRVYMSIYSKFLRTSTNGIGFKARFAANEAISALIKEQADENSEYTYDYGIRFESTGLDGEMDINMNKEFKPGKDSLTPNKVIIIASGVLNPDGTTENYSDCASRELTATPYIKLTIGGETYEITGESESTSLNDLIKLADSKHGSLSTNVKENIEKTLDAYSTYFATLGLTGFTVTAAQS